MRHLALLFIFACGPKTPPDSVTPASSADLGGVASEVVASLPDWPGFAKIDGRPRVVVMPTDNRTKYKFDTHLATAKVVNGLIQRADGRFHVIDPEAWATRQAATTTAEEAGARIFSAVGDPGLLMLHSEVQSTVTDAADGRSAIHVLVTYRLVEADSARAVWAWSTEWTKARGELGFEVVERRPHREPQPVEPPGDRDGTASLFDLMAPAETIPERSEPSESETEAVGP